MKRLITALVLCAAVTSPAALSAQDEEMSDGFSLLEEGAKIILRSMIDEVEPTLKELHKEFGYAMEEMGPALRDLALMIGDLSNYHPPEKLPNGDIILRRKEPEIAPDLIEPGEEIDI